MLATGGVEWPEEACRPAALNANGYAGIRFLLRLSLEGAQFMKELLVRDTWPVRAQAELELTGIAPRLPVKIAFDPPLLHRLLAELCDESGLVSEARLFNFFPRSAAAIGLTLDGEPAALASLRNVGRLGPFAIRLVCGGASRRWPRLFGIEPSERRLGEGGMGFIAADDDLADNRCFARTVRHGAPSCLLRGLETIVPPPVIVPPLTTGFHQVDISANIPEPGRGY
ncbi:hypothetical protein [Cohnella faecalis]|uniref:Uncharacterized protein n=1 Tax=Cohnella faecalis TaxID=2315694 RepID=A0A398CLG2_9BACL|nr:hypothetical protein [Cohnella faecalis]RIE03503.1 hypothetical protein D3H35_12710 [Cohnella faecalis]